MQLGHCQGQCTESRESKKQQLHRLVLGQIRLNSEEINLSTVPEVGKIWQNNLKQGHGKVWQALHKNGVCAHQSFMKTFQISHLLLQRTLIERLARDVDTMLYPLFIVSSCLRTRRRRVDRLDNVVHCHIIQFS